MQDIACTEHYTKCLTVRCIFLRKHATSHSIATKSTDSTDMTRLENLYGLGRARMINMVSSVPAV